MITQFSQNLFAFRDSEQRCVRKIEQILAPFAIKNDHPATCCKARPTFIAFMLLAHIYAFILA